MQYIFGKFMLQQDVTGMWTGGVGKLMVGGAETFLVRNGKDREEIGEDEEHRNAQSIVAHSAFGVCEERLIANT